MRCNNGAVIAAQELTRDGGVSPTMVDGVPSKHNPYLWLRRLVAAVLDGQNSEEVLEHTKLELFHDQVFCFTPKGRIIALPRGATPIDFAYGVHTDVGNGCIGAIINGRQMPLRTVLKNGDEVEILTTKDQVPPSAWEQIAITGRARGAIRRAVRDAQRKQYVELGRRLLTASAQKAGVEMSLERVKRVAARLGHKSADDVFAAVGQEDTSIFDVLTALNPNAALDASAAKARTGNNGAAQSGVQDEGWFNLSRVMGLKFKLPFGEQLGLTPKPAEPAVNEPTTTAAPPASISLKGLKNDIAVTFDAGGAVPGDRIVGVMAGKEGIKIFQIHSPRLAEYEHERWIDVRWDVDQVAAGRFPARIAVTVQNEPGTLAEIARVIGERGGNIDNLRMTRRASDFTEMLIELEVTDADHLNGIIAGLKSKDSVSAVERLFE